MNPVRLAGILGTTYSVQHNENLLVTAERLPRMSLASWCPPIKEEDYVAADGFCITSRE